jgi:nitrogen regulatory protein PII
MSTLNSKTNISLVNLILPKDALSSVSTELQKAGAKGIFHIAARGSIISEGGFLAKMFPPPSPEQCLVQVLVPDSEKQRFTDIAIATARLDKMGSGAIFSISCQSAQFTNYFPLTDGNEDSSHTSSGDALEAICCICEKGVAEDIAQAALSAGAPGPTVTFGEGGGIRDKIPMLRMTKGPEKEFVWCVVDRSESNDVFTNMARAGRITEPGRGFMYSIPVSDGLINVSSTVSSSSHGASMEQVISVIDELKGSKDWRSSGDNKSASLNTTFLKDLIGLYCVVPRDYYSDVYDSILEAGAPGVSTNFGVMGDQSGSDGETCNEEWALVYTSLAPSSVESVKDKISAKLQSIDVDRYAFYTLPIPKALTYLGG